MIRILFLVVTIFAFVMISYKRIEKLKEMEQTERIEDDN